VWKCVLPDSSEFVMPYPDWEKALRLKYGNTIDKPEFKANFAGWAAQLWGERKVFTKVGIVTWDEFFANFKYEGLEGKTAFENMAQLAEVCMYYSLRAPLMSIILREHGGGRVIGISGGGVARYNGERKEVFKDIGEALEE